MRIAGIVQQGRLKIYPFNIFDILDVGTNQLQVPRITRIKHFTVVSRKLNAGRRMIELMCCPNESHFVETAEMIRKNLNGKETIEAGTTLRRQHLLQFFRHSIVANNHKTERTINKRIGAVVYQLRAEQSALLPVVHGKWLHAVLFHEMAHYYLHFGKDRKSLTKDVKELEAEAVSYMVSSACGIVNDESSSYIREWAGSNAYEEIQGRGQKLIDVALKIIDDLKLGELVKFKQNYMGGVDVYYLTSRFMEWGLVY